MPMMFLYEALRAAIDEEMSKDSTVLVLGEDVGHYGGSYKVTKDLHLKYGDLRVLDTPIAENSFTGMAIGAAMTGLRPIVEGMNMGFMLLAFNQISNNLSMLRYTSGGNFNIPVVIRGPGGVGKQLGAEHSQRLESCFQSIPGLRIVACSTAYNAKGLLKSAITEKNPILFLEHVLLYNLKGFIPYEEYYLRLDKAEIVRYGSEVTIVTYSRMRYHVLTAADKLVLHGRDPEIIDLISLKPLDLYTIGQSVQKTHKLVIVEECTQTGGIAAELISLINTYLYDELDSPAVRLSSKDVPTPYSGTLEKQTIIQPDQIFEVIINLLKHQI
nr:pyruvate dehydrogenase E1 component beta subunit [Cyanidiaceae sp.]